MANDLMDTLGPVSCIGKRTLGVSNSVLCVLFSEGPLAEVPCAVINVLFCCVR